MAYRRFTLNWLCLDELSFDRVKNVPVRVKTPGFRVIACYDGTQISPVSAFELLKAFTPAAPVGSNGEGGPAK